MKIAIISSNPHDRIGGTETYARNFINCFADDHQITEFPIMLGGKKISEIDHRVRIDNSLIGVGPDDLIWYGTYKNKNIKKIYSNYDVVLLNNVFPPKKYLKNKKTVLIQHMNVDFYTFRGKPFWLGIGSFFSWALFGVSGTIGNPFKKAHNVVFFDESTSCKTFSNKFYIPLPSAKIQIEDDNRNGFVWIGRLENQQKNIIDAAYIANEVENLNIYGSGKDSKKMLSKMINTSQYKGTLKPKEVEEVLAKSKALVLTSNWEGFPFTMVEALHAGAYIFLYDTFDAIKYFQKSGQVIVAKDRNDMIDKIKEFDKQKHIFSNQFAKANLTIEQFKSKWEKVLESVQNEKA